jgi:hypothetical protein
MRVGFERVGTCPDSSRALGIFCAASEESQEVAGVLLEGLEGTNRLDVDGQEVVAQSHRAWLASLLIDSRQQGTEFSGLESCAENLDNGSPAPDLRGCKSRKEQTYQPYPL